jgi:glycopeptide antibiotics resistance protein
MTQLWRSFGDLAPLLVLVAIATLLGLLFVGRLSEALRRTATAAVLVTWLLGVAAVTLLPAGGLRGRSADLVPFRSTLRMVTDAVDWEVATAQAGGNVALFVPLGLLLPLLSATRYSLGRTLAIASTIGVCIETAQWLLALGRVTSIDDVIFAALGATMGWAISRLLRQLAPSTYSTRNPRQPTHVAG